MSVGAEEAVVPEKTLWCSYGVVKAVIELKYFSDFCNRLFLQNIH